MGSVHASDDDPTPGSVSWTHESGRSVVFLRGEHDFSTAATVSAALTWAIAFDEADLVLDLSAIEFMDASTAGVISRIEAELGRRKRPFVLRSPSKGARVAIELHGLARLIEARNGDDGALAGPRLRPSAARVVDVGDVSVAQNGPRHPSPLAVTELNLDSTVSSIEEKTTALIEAVETQARARERADAIAGGMGEALVELDANGDVTGFNGKAGELMGLTAAAARHRAARQVIRGRTADGGDLVEQVLKPSPTRWSTLATVSHTDGTEVPVAVTCRPLRGTAGEAAGSVVVLRDIRKELGVERMKHEFLSRVGHELRTPLTGIIGCTELLIRGRVPPTEMLSCHVEVLGLAKSLQRIVEMLEFFAAAAAGLTLLRPKPLSVRLLVDDVVAGWADRLATGRITSHVEADIPEISGDSRWLRSALDELIGNAVEFSPDGGPITVTAVGTTSTSGDRGVGITVEDRGAGIRDDDLERLFEAFVQADMSDTRHHGGLGLGLSLVRRVVEGLGGRVSVASCAAGGSRFSLLLPCRPAEQAADVPAAGEELRIQPARAV